MHSDKARRIAFDALFAALALMFTFVEIKLPVSAAIPIPGFRLGLANIAVMAAAYSFSFADAAFTAILKIMLSSLLFFKSGVVFVFGCGDAFVSCRACAFLYGHRKAFQPCRSIGGLRSFSHRGTACRFLCIFRQSVASLRRISDSRFAYKRNCHGCRNGAYDADL